MTKRQRVALVTRALLPPLPNPAGGTFVKIIKKPGRKSPTDRRKLARNGKALVRGKSQLFGGTWFWIDDPNPELEATLAHEDDVYPL